MLCYVINDKIAKAYGMLDVIKRRFTNMSRDCLFLLYKCMVRSHLEYANSVWYHSRISDIEKLEKVQKKAIKLIHGLHARTHTHTCTHTHTHTQPFYDHLGFCLDLPGWACTRKVKPGRYKKGTIVKITTRCDTKVNKQQTATPLPKITWLSVGCRFYGHRCWTNIFSLKFLHVSLGVGGWRLGYEDRRCCASWSCS